MADRETLARHFSFTDGDAIHTYVLHKTSTIRHCVTRSLRIMCKTRRRKNDPDYWFDYLPFEYSFHRKKIEAYPWNLKVCLCTKLLREDMKSDMRRKNEDINFEGEVNIRKPVPYNSSHVISRKIRRARTHCRSECWTLVVNGKGIR